MKTPRITTGMKAEPFLGILHGPHGIGKTCFGMKMPNPIYITGEETGEYNIARFDKCTTWQEFLDCLTFLRDGDHQYLSVVLDTLDSLESLLHRKILGDEGKGLTMATSCGGYGKAYEKANNAFYKVIDDYLVPLRNKGMNILMLAHSTTNKVEDPLTQSSYDRYELKLHKNSKGVGAYSIFTEWVSVILFANFEVYKTDDEKYAVGEGRRLMYSQPRPAFDAKNRFSLPYEMQLDWAEVATGIKKYYSEGGAGKEQAPHIQQAGRGLRPEGEVAKTVVETVTQNVNEEKTIIDRSEQLNPPQDSGGQDEVVKANIAELLTRLTDKTLIERVKIAVASAGKDLTELGRIQGKLLKAV